VIFSYYRCQHVGFRIVSGVSISASYIATHITLHKFITYLNLYKIIRKLRTTQIKLNEKGKMKKFRIQLLNLISDAAVVVGERRREVVVRRSAIEADADI